MANSVSLFLQGFGCNKISSLNDSLTYQCAVQSGSSLGKVIVVLDSGLEPTYNANPLGM